jgi:large conductance mechanosensitive channel
MADVENNHPVYQKASILVELRNFMLGGDFIKLACAFVIALALQKLITQFVASFITPILGIIGSRSFQDLDFRVRGSKFSYGLFIDALISFIIIVLALFFCLILPLQRHAGKIGADAWVVRFCDYCCSTVPAIASKCSHCCSELTPQPINKGRSYK